MAERTATAKMGISEDQNEGQYGWSTVRPDRVREPDEQNPEALDVSLR